MTDKIRRFLADKEMSETVKSVLYKNFLQKREGDVHTLAAQTLAVQFLEDAWRELERYRPEPKREDKLTNPGL